MMHECPQCGDEMELEEAEPDVGVEGGWVCRTCGYAELAEPTDFEDDV
jgi:DNA-directed RNA polymerase subunit M/transcription elongation factor TFIIS